MFQSTPLCEGRRGRVSNVAGILRFNPRPSVRGDTSCSSVSRRERGFNPRPSVRGDPYHSRFVWRHAGFNPRPSVRGDRVGY